MLADGYLVESNIMMLQENRTLKVNANLSNFYILAMLITFLLQSNNNGTKE